MPKKYYNYSDIVALRDFPKKDEFYFNGKKYGTYFGRGNGELLIKCWTDGGNGIKLSSFIYGLNKKLGIKNEPNPTSKPIPQNLPIKQKIDISTYIDKLSDPQKLSEPFLRLMQLYHIFYDDYLKSEHIKLYNNKHEVLYFSSNKNLNLRYKWNGENVLGGWYTFKGLGNVGAFLRGANKKRSTLILLEGLKDGINGNISLPQCDILVTDSENSPYNWNYLKKKYKTIIFFQDRGVEHKPTALKKLFEKLYGEDRAILNKMYYIDYNKIQDDSIKDITDFIFSLGMTTKGVKRNTLSRIKKILHTQRVKQLLNNIEITEIINPKIEQAKRYNNLSFFKQLLRKKLLLNGDITEDIKYYVKSQVTPPTHHTEIKLMSSKYLTFVVDDIISIFKRYSKVLLGSPTGTGKSTFTKEDLTKHYKNMIIIASLKKIAGELSESRSTNITYIENNERIEEVLANINSPYISLTTDTLYNLLHREDTKDIMRERLRECEMVVFDEQHLVHQSQNFRGKVVWVNDYLRDNYNGKVLAMSGTPIYADLPNFHPVLAKLDNSFLSTIAYYTDYFKDETDLLGHMKSKLLFGNILIYSKSRKYAKYIYKYLIEQGINTLLITSRENKKKMSGDSEEVEIDDSGINNISDNVAIVSTTRATTGVNFKKLSTIYQFGSAYDTHTFIQLMARIRGNGEYYFIKMASDKAQDESIMNKAINILNMAKNFNLNKIGDLFNDYRRSEYIQQNVELPYGGYNLETFLNVYRRVLSLINSEGLGKFTDDGGDFEFTKRLEDIDSSSFEGIFTNGDSNEFTKYIEREMIDFLQRKGNVEVLNEAYNLSFKIKHMNRDIDYGAIEPKQLITIEDLAEREKAKEERKAKEDEFEKAVSDKFGWLLTDRNKKDFSKAFSRGELSTLLLDKRLDNPTIQKKILGSKASKNIPFSTVVNRIKFFLVPKNKIVQEIVSAIKIKEFVTVEELSKILEQKVRLTMKKAKSPFAPFIRDFLEDENILKDDLKFFKRKKIKGIEYWGVITLSDARMKEIKEIRAKEERELQRLKALEELNKKYEKSITFYREVLSGEDLNLAQREVLTRKAREFEEERVKAYESIGEKCEPLFTKNHYFNSHFKGVDTPTLKDFYYRNKDKIEQRYFVLAIKKELEDRGVNSDP